jgi:MOSC domain-containing protein YiiM
MRAPERQGPRVSAVLVGRAVPFSRPGSFSAIAKTAVDGSVAVGPEGLQGDEHGDPRVHGGVDKAVHLYAFEHYAAWRAELGPLRVLDRPGAFGENLSTAGLTEDEVCLGDRIRVGTTLLEVTQSRQPCWKLNDRFGVPDMARRVQDTLRSGWYCRVLESGSLQAGDAIELVERPHPEWPLSLLMEMLYRRRLDRGLLALARALPLVPSWQRLIERRLEEGRVEDWTSRLDGPSP